MRKEFMAAILVSSLALVPVGSVVVRHYMAPTAYELNHEAIELNTSMNTLWLEQMEQTTGIESHPDLFRSTMEMKASFEQLQQAHQDLITQTYGDMATHDPVRFQFRRAECWVRKEDSARCRAVNTIART